MKTLPALLTGGILLTAALAQSPQTPVSDSATLRRLELPPEPGTYRKAPGVELAQAFCLTCHSSEYAESQPPLPDAYWEGTVKKMKEKFGAPLPDEMIAPLTKYMLEAYGKDSKTKP